MKRQFIFGTMLSAVIATGVAAQQPPAGTSGQTGTRPGQTSDSAQTITVSGCLQAAAAPGTPAASSTAPAASSPSAAPSGGFVLTNATTGTGTMARESSPTGAPGTAPAATGTSGTASASAGTTYRLVGGDDADLQKNVGKKVEVTGSVAARGTSSPSASPSTSTPTPGSMASGSGQGMAGQAFQVKTVRPTGESCGQ